MNIIKSLVYDFSVIGKGIIFPHFCDVSNYEKLDCWNEVHFMVRGLRICTEQ